MTRAFRVTYVIALALAAVAGAFALVAPPTDWDLLEPLPRGLGSAVTVQGRP